MKGNKGTEFENKENRSAESVNYPKKLLVSTPSIRYVNGATEENLDKRFWFDDLHVTAAVHKLIAEDVTKELRKWFEPKS